MICEDLVENNVLYAANVKIDDEMWITFLK